MDGHIPHQQGVFYAARRGLHMVDHMVQRHVGGIRKAQLDHSYGIPHQDDIHAGLIQQASRGIIISGNQRHMPRALAGADAFRLFNRLIHGINKNVFYHFSATRSGSVSSVTSSASRRETVFFWSGRTRSGLMSESGFSTNFLKWGSRMGQDQAGGSLITRPPT